MIGVRSQAEARELLDNAILVDSKGFKPAFWMIDKAASEKKGILEGTEFIIHL